MSGGAWGYQCYKIVQKADEMRDRLRAVADTEEIVDRARCADTARDKAERDLFELWESVFDRLYG